MRRIFTCVLVAAAGLWGCGGGDGGNGTAADAVAGAGDAADVAADTVDDATAPVVYDRPAWFPAADDPADEALGLRGLDGPVRVVFDDRGIAHVYGSSRRDVAFAHGWVHGRQRLFQAHVLRMAASGRLAELTGAGSVRGDILLRMHRLRSTAEQMATALQRDDPEVYGWLEAYAAGINTVIDAVNGGDLPQPVEVDLFNLVLEPWTPVDTLAFGRLQTWQLSFTSGYPDDAALSVVRALQARFDGTPLEGLDADVFLPAPAAQTPTITAAEAGREPAAATFEPREVVRQDFYRDVPLPDAASLRRFHRELHTLPHKILGTDQVGSNNWVVAGRFTASGAAMLANDTHLGLSNPSIWHHIHLNTAAAGGDLDAAGVGFASAPGVVIGHSRHGAWGATVVASDVTDVFVEQLTADGSAVVFRDAEVPLVDHTEVITYTRPGDGPCDAVVTEWVTNLRPSVRELPEARCELTVTWQEVPHHGPIIPWSYASGADGARGAMTWRWTGYEPTGEFQAISGLSVAKDTDGFFATLARFGVGAQNWVWAGADGDIAWFPAHRVPRRAHVEAGRTDRPPWLPLPGDGSAEWDGFVDYDDLPQARNPVQGYLVTANADPIGITFDDDPFNDGPYLGAFWTEGFRMHRAAARVAALTERGGITPEDMQAVQADHHSNLGERLVPPLLAAYDAAKAGGPGADQLDATVEAAAERLRSWSLKASSGVGAAAGSTEADDAVATSIFNVFAVFLVRRVLHDKGLETISDGLRARLLLRLVEQPESLSTWDQDAGATPMWDDLRTEDVVEERADALLGSLADAVRHLAGPGDAGAPGGGRGFDTDDMGAWRWGALHTVKLSHNAVPLFDIPPADEHPFGFPRHGDLFSVDASHPGLGDLDFSYGHGPAIRLVVDMASEPKGWNVIPGGQDERPDTPHYRDEMDRWVKNEAPRVPFTEAEVLAAQERIVDLVPAPAP